MAFAPTTPNAESAPTAPDLLARPKVVAAVQAFAWDLVRRGIARAEITRLLESKGLDRPTAEAAIDATIDAHRKAVQKAGWRNIFLGLLLLPLGVIVFLAMMAGAAAQGGGFVGFTWLPIIIGGILLARGLSQVFEQ